jgi:hypothetical protein
VARARHTGCRRRRDGGVTADHLAHAGDARRDRRS